MPYDLRSNLWPEKKEAFYRNNHFRPIQQVGQHCASTVLAILTKTTPEVFQNEGVNTQDPVSWSNALQTYGMKLAYCPSDIRKLQFYIDELISLDDLFLLCYYSPIGCEILLDPNEKEWVCGSHVVILHRDKVIDPKRGDSTPAKDHNCIHHHTKRLFRVVPVKHPRGL